MTDAYSSRTVTAWVVALAIVVAAVFGFAAGAQAAQDAGNLGGERSLLEEVCETE